MLKFKVGKDQPTEAAELLASDLTRHPAWPKETGSNP